MIGCGVLIDHRLIINYLVWMLDDCTKTIFFSWCLDTKLWVSYHIPIKNCRQIGIFFFLSIKFLIFCVHVSWEWNDNIRALHRYTVLSYYWCCGFDNRTGMAILEHSIFYSIHFWPEIPQKYTNVCHFASIMSTHVHSTNVNRKYRTCTLKVRSIPRPWSWFCFSFSNVFDQISPQKRQIWCGIEVST